MRQRKTILLSLVLALFTSAATLAGSGGSGGGNGGGGNGGGGGGSGGGSAPTNILVGKWGGENQEGTHLTYDFTFNKNFTFSVAIFDPTTRLQIGTVTGTYGLGGVGPDGFTLLTLISDGEIFMQGELSYAFEGLTYRNTPVFYMQIVKLG